MERGAASMGGVAGWLMTKVDRMKISRERQQPQKKFTLSPLVNDMSKHLRADFWRSFFETCLLVEDMSNICARPLPRVVSQGSGSAHKNFRTLGARGVVGGGALSLGCHLLLEDVHISDPRNEKVS